MWIAYGRRPLHVDELRHALAIQIGDLEFDEDNIPSSKIIVESCSGLVTIDHVSLSVRLVHYTLQDYIQDQRHNSVMCDESSFANSCLTYLLFDFASPTIAKEDIDVVLEKYPLLAYASEHWGHHADKASSEGVQDLALKFLMDEPKLSRSVQILDALSPWFDRKSNVLRGITRPQRRKSIGGPYKAKKHKQCPQVGRNLRPSNSPRYDSLIIGIKHLDQTDGTQIRTWCGGLHCAAGFGLSDLITLLLHKGIYIESEDDRGNTALHTAASYGRKHATNMLLRNAANPNALNHEWITPLYLASWANNSEIIQLLLLHGAHMDMPCKDEWTALHKAADAGSFESVKLLLHQGASVSLKTARGLTPLHRAAGRGSTEIIQLLLEYGSEVDALTHDTWTPLHGACSRGQESVAKLLLEHGANINAVSLDGRTPLHRASRVAYNGTVSLLLRHGADRLIKCAFGKIALHMAAQGGHDSTLQLLLQEQSEQLFVLDTLGRTARDEALCGGHYGTARLLKQMEVSTVDQSSEGRSELDLAIESQDVAQVEALIQEGADMDLPNADGWRPLHQALTTDSIPIASLLLQNGANVEATTTSRERQTALHYAARRGNAIGVKLCLSYGAAVNALNGQGQTALHVACQSGNIDTVVQLLDGKANIEANDHYHFRPIHKAASEGHEEILRILLERGADPELRTRNGLSLQACAARNGHYALVEFIRQLR